MITRVRHSWAFARRFRRRAFGWKSQPAVAAVRAAVAEIKKAARLDPAFGGEGAVLFLEKLAPAIEQVDGSSGAIGSAVNSAIEGLVPIIAAATVSDTQRDTWLRRLYAALEEDQMPYIEQLADHWGELCAEKERASAWADEFLEGTRQVLTTEPHVLLIYKGTNACFSALFSAGRYAEIMHLLQLPRADWWHCRQWGVKTLSSLGRPHDAIAFAEASHHLNEPVHAKAEVCEQVLLAHGLKDEAYTRYALLANQRLTYLATFRALAAKYPEKPAAEILRRLVDTEPGNAGKWFAAAKDAGLFEEAIDLVTKSPCDPKTLARAARDFSAENPAFALGAGLAALRWLVAGYGYEITSLDVLMAIRGAMAAAGKLNVEEDTRRNIRELMARSSSPDPFLLAIVAKEFKQGPS